MNRLSITPFLITITLIILFFLILAPGKALSTDLNQTGNITNDSFSKAKKILLTKIYSDPEHRIDLYCGCAYDGKKAVDFSSCGYVPEKDNNRAHRIEWEHVVPVEAFGQSFKEWREGHPDCVDNRGKAFKGRKCAEKVNHEFRRMQADMYNLYPAAGEPNRKHKAT